MDRLQAMHLFVRVAELGSFSAVAQQMGLARSAVTRQIAALEQLAAIEAALGVHPGLVVGKALQLLV